MYAKIELVIFIFYFPRCIFLNRCEITVTILNAISDLKLHYEWRLARACTDVTNSILTCNALSGCETVAKLSGIGKTTALNILKKGQHHLDNFSNSSSTTTDHADLVQQSTGLFTSCYGVKDNISHYYVRSSFPSLVIKEG